MPGEAVDSPRGPLCRLCVALDLHSMEVLNVGQREELALNSLLFNRWWCLIPLSTQP